MGERAPRISTTHLGQFTHEHAEAIAGALEGAGIVWWYKTPGYLSQIWEKGVRLFVDQSRLGEAQAIARSVLQAEPGSEGGQGSDRQEQPDADDGGGGAQPD